MCKLVIYTLCCVVLAGCSEITPSVLDFIVPKSYDYMVVDELAEETYFFGDPSSSFVLAFENNVISGPKQIFHDSKFGLADHSDLEYFKETFSIKGRLTPKNDYQLFRGDIIAASIGPCRNHPCAVYLLASKSDNVVYIEILSF